MCTAGNIGMPGDAGLAGHRQGANLATPCRESAACAVCTLDQKIAHRLQALVRVYATFISWIRVCAGTRLSRANFRRIDTIDSPSNSHLISNMWPGPSDSRRSSRVRIWKRGRNERGPLTRERVHGPSHDGTEYIRNDARRQSITTCQGNILEHPLARYP